MSKRAVVFTSVLWIAVVGIAIVYVLKAWLQDPLTGAGTPFLVAVGFLAVVETVRSVGGSIEKAVLAGPAARARGKE